MNSSWEFGWDAIGSIVGILALIGFIIVEWGKISEFMSSVFVSYLVVYGLMVFVGFSLLQASIFWRLSSLMIVGLYGLIIGTNLQESNTPTQQSGFDYSKYSRRRNIITKILFLGVLGISSGLVLASL